MIRNVVILTSNDLAIAFQNKSLYLILFIPLFLFAVLHLLGEGEPEVQKIRIGLLDKANYPPALVASLESAEHIFAISSLPGEAQAIQWLQDGHGDGILVPHGTQAENSVLVVPDRASLQAVAIMEAVSGLQRTLEGRSNAWIAEIRSLQDSGLKKQMLPTWVLMLVLVVGFIVLPTQVAEEKEKRLLLGLLQTPIHEVEWLAAKVSFGTITILVATFILHILTKTNFELNGALSYFAFLVAGSFCFSSCGILVGFLCRTQASARSLGVLFYLPLLLPSALSDYSKTLSDVAPFLPSYQFYLPIKSILLEGGSFVDFPVYFLSLLTTGILMSFLSYHLMIKRWLM